MATIHFHETTTSTPEPERRCRCLTSERLADALGKPADVVETTVRGELERLRAAAWIQTFVLIFAERSARNRLAS